MELGAPSSSGLLGSLRRLTDSMLGAVQDRIELLSVELQEEKQRILQTLGWMVAFVVTALLAVVFVTLAIIVVFWDTRARVPVVVSVAALYTIAAVVTGLKLRRRVKEQPRPFAGTLEELRADRECIRPNS